MGITQGVVPAVRCILERLGYRVRERVPVEELKDLEVHYDLLAEREGRRVLVAVTSASPESLLVELAKAANVKGEVLVLAQGSLPSGYGELAEGRVKVVAFERVGELEEKLSRAL